MKQTFFKYFLQAFLGLGVLVFSGCSFKFSDYTGEIDMWDSTSNSTARNISDKEVGENFNLNLFMNASEFDSRITFNGSFGYLLYSAGNHISDVTYQDAGIHNYGVMNNSSPENITKTISVSSPASNIGVLFGVCMENMVKHGSLFTGITYTVDTSPYNKDIAGVCTSECPDEVSVSGLGNVINNPTPCYKSHYSSDTFNIDYPASYYYPEGSIDAWDKGNGIGNKIIDDKMADADFTLVIASLDETAANLEAKQADVDVTYWLHDHNTNQDISSHLNFNPDLDLSIEHTYNISAGYDDVSVQFNIYATQKNGVYKLHPNPTNDTTVCAANPTTPCNIIIDSSDRFAIVESKGTFDAWDSSKNISNKTIDDKISGSDFELTMASTNIAKTALNNKMDGALVTYWLHDHNTNSDITSTQTFNPNTSQTTDFTYNVANSYDDVSVQFKMYATYNGSDYGVLPNPTNDTSTCTATQVSATPCNRTIDSSDRFKIIQSNGTFDAWDVSQNVTDISIADKLAGIAFDLSIASTNINKTALNLKADNVVVNYILYDNDANANIAGTNGTFRPYTGQDNNIKSHNFTVNSAYNDVSVHFDVYAAYNGSDYSFFPNPTNDTTTCSVTQVTTTPCNRTIISSNNFAIVESTGTFDAWDSTKDINNKTIDDKISGEEFELTIASTNFAKTALNTKADGVLVNYWLHDNDSDLNTSEDTFNPFATQTINKKFTINGSFPEVVVQFRIYATFDNGDYILHSNPTNDTTVCAANPTTPCNIIIDSSDSFSIIENVGSFDAWDTDKDVSTKAISDKFSSESFDLVIASTNFTKTELNKKVDGTTVDYWLYDNNRSISISSENIFDPASVQTITQSYIINDEHTSVSVRFRIYASFDGSDYKYFTKPASPANPDTCSSATEITATPCLRVIDSTNTFDINIPTLTTNQRNFTIRNPIDTRNINGNMKVIGNTVLCNKVYEDSNGWLREHSSCVENSGNNNDKILQNVNTKSGYTNSSDATISDIPNDAEVVWAALYTQAYLYQNQNTVTNGLNNNPVYLIRPDGTRLDVYPETIDLHADSDDFQGHTYSTYSPLDSLIGMKGSQVNGVWTGANISTTYSILANPIENTPHSSGITSLGFYGAWSLVLIYKDKDESLKNISVYDGYKVVHPDNDDVEISISGFLTPTNGPVESTLSLFAAEGDTLMTGDGLYIHDDTEYKTIEGTNAFKSETSGFEKNPTLINNFGIDIQNHNIGTSGLNFIKNGATSTKIKLSTTQDVYFPSMIAFTTELYEPRVCYSQEITQEDPYTLLVETWISNMKKDTNDLNLEDAINVQISLEHDSENLEYINDSTSIKNINENVYTSKTDVSGDDIVDNDNDTNTTHWRVGTGASVTDGGLIQANPNEEENKKVFVSYKARPLSKGNVNISNRYRASYKNSSLGLSFNGAYIESCSGDENNSMYIYGPPAKFNVVNENFSNASDINNNLDIALYTQTANKNFNVKILSLDENRTNLEDYSKDVNLSIIETSTDNTLSNLEKELYCNNSTPLTEFTSRKITFSGTTMDVENINYQKANKNLSFKVTYEDDKNVTKHSCSIDSFAVRPDRFILSAPAGEILLTSAKDYNLSLIAAKSDSSSATQDYNLTDINIEDAFDANISNIKKYKTFNSNEDVDNTELAGELSLSEEVISILDGMANDVVGISYDEVGKIKITLEDKTWAKVDIDNGDTDADCYGAYICGEIDLQFIPAKFDLTAMTLNNNNNGFTYLANDLNASAATLGVTITAKNDDGNIVKNFKNAYWENPVDINISLTTPNGMKLNTDAISDTKNLGFSDGVANIIYSDTNSSRNLRLNFDRNITNAINPFKIGIEDITLTAISAYTINGDINKTVATTSPSTSGSDATFLYAKAHAREHIFKNNSGTINMFYEVYCDSSCKTNNTIIVDNKSSRDLVDTDDFRWFINPLHDTSKNGYITEVNEYNGNLGSEKVVPHNSIVTGTYNSSIILQTTALITEFPFAKDMLLHAPSHLIFGLDESATSNSFRVVFGSDTNESDSNKTTSNSGVGAWNGNASSNNVRGSNRSGSARTNNRTMW